MSEDQGLRYEIYTGKSLVVYGNREKYESVMKGFGPRWLTKLKNDKSGWIIPRENEEKLKELIASLGQSVPEPEPVPQEEKPKKKYARKKAVVEEPVTELPAVAEPEPIPVPQEEKPKKKYARKKAVVEEPVTELPAVAEPEPIPIPVPQEEKPKKKYTKKSETLVVPPPSPPVVEVIPESEHEESEHSEDMSEHSEDMSEHSESEDMSEHSESESESEEETNNRRIMNPHDKLSKKSKETFISKYVNSDDEVDPDESRKILEKYQKLFTFFRSFSERPEKFDHEKTRRMRD